MFKIIGLTGGIGCGKTTFSHAFCSLGVPVLDADESAHRLCQPYELGWQAIVALWGKDFLNADESLNRPLLREQVFKDKEFKEKWEACLHPLIFRDIQEQTEHYRKVGVPYIIWSIPLLLESKRYLNEVNRILVIDVPVSVQVERVLKRGITLDIAYSIIASQVSRSIRQRYADDLVINIGKEHHLPAIVGELHRSYLGFIFVRDKFFSLFKSNA
jgi:dephospho-CoA kinase